MFTPRFQVTYLVAMVVVFTLVALFTRATLRRVLGALGSVVVFTALSAPIDALGVRGGFWRFPGCIDPPHPPLAIYIGQSLMYVGCLAFIAWRVERRFGTNGLTVLAPIAIMLGALRDFAVGSMLPQMIQFGPMPASLLADMAAWAVVVAVALGVSRLIAGPARDDPPR